jgi:DNA-binding response OmpR family regulator
MVKQTNNVLIIDNDPLTCGVLKKALEERGYETRISPDGEDLFDKQRKIPVPDLIVTEIMELRPQMDTFRFVRALKSSDKTKHTKVVICSKRGSQEDKNRGKSAGADEYVVKPFQPHEMVERIEMLFGKHRREASAPAGIAQGDKDGAKHEHKRSWVDFRRGIDDVPEDKRQYPRLEFHCPVRIEGISGIHRITDISLGGAFVEYQTPSTFKVGEIHHLIVKVPTEYEPIKVKAQVANLQKRGIGFKYVDLSRRNQEIIRFCFDTFKDTIPLQ